MAMAFLEDQGRLHLIGSLTFEGVYRPILRRTGCRVVAKLNNSRALRRATARTAAAALD